jgi:hypothetical protein
MADSEDEKTRSIAGAPPTVSSPDKESMATSSFLQGSLKRSLPDGRVVHVFLPGMPGYEEAGKLVEQYQQKPLPQKLYNLESMQMPPKPTPPSTPEPPSPAKVGGGISPSRVKSMSLVPNPQLVQLLNEGWEIVPEEPPQKPQPIVKPLPPASEAGGMRKPDYVLTLIPAPEHEKYQKLGWEFIPNGLPQK